MLSWIEEIFTIVLLIGVAWIGVLFLVALMPQ